MNISVTIMVSVFYNNAYMLMDHAQQGDEGGGGGWYLTKFNTRSPQPRSPTPYPFIYHFGTKGTPFMPTCHNFFM